MLLLHNELLLTQLVLLYCDFTVFAGWIDKKKNCSIPIKILTECEIPTIIDGHNSSESSRELKKITESCHYFI
jgi:hypothetical protein